MYICVCIYASLIYLLASVLVRAHLSFLDAGKILPIETQQGGLVFRSGRVVAALGDTTDQVHLTQSVNKVALHNTIPAQIRQLIFCIRIS